MLPHDIYCTSLFRLLLLMLPLLLQLMMMMIIMLVPLLIFETVGILPGDAVVAVALVYCPSSW